MFFIFLGRNGTAFWRKNSSQPVVRIIERRRTSIKKRKGVTGQDGRTKSQIGTT